MSDRDVSQYKRIEKAVHWFFVGEPPDIGLPEIFQAFTEFINPKKITEEDSDDESDGEPDNEKQYDYDFDADEIYASFISEYGIDLIDVEFLHWHKFKILLTNLSGDSAFKNKIELRFMDISRFKGQALADIQRAKESVQLPVDLSAEEEAQRGEFEGLWGRI